MSLSPPASRGGGGSLTVTDGSTTITDVTTASFVGSAVVGDNGGGNAEIAIRPTLAQVLDEDNDGGGNGMTNTGGITTGGANVDTGGGNIDSGGGDLDLGAGQVASDIVMATGKKITPIASGIILASGTATFDDANAEEIPASPSVQDIATALVNLGLVTQAAP